MHPVKTMRVAFVVGATFCFVHFVSASPAVRWRREQAPEIETFHWSENERFPFVFPVKGDNWPGFSNHFLRCFLTTYETFAISNNTHWDIYFLPQKLETDKRHHVVAASWVELFEDLRTIETAHRIYRGLAEKFVLPRSTYSDKENVRNLIINMNFEEMADTWFEELGRGLAKDPLVGQRYGELKSKYEALVALQADHLEKEKVSSSLLHSLFAKRDSLTRVKELRVNLIFAGLLRNGDDVDDAAENARKLEFRVMAKTMVEMSKNADKYEKLQQIYRESVAEAAKHVLYSLNEVGSEATALYRYLKEKIKADPAISAEFEQKKKDILEKLNKKA